MPAGFYEDPGGDFIPAAVQEQIGGDPEAEDCTKSLGCRTARDVDPSWLGEASNTPLILDSSGSMAGPAGDGERKIDAAETHSVAMSPARRTATTLD